MSDIGEKIISAITKSQMLKIEHFPHVERMAERHQIRFQPSAAEQLEAVVEAHIEDRVRIRLELDRQAFAAPIFSDRARMEAEVLKWFDEHPNVQRQKIANVCVALQQLGYLKNKPISARVASVKQALDDLYP